MIAHRSLKERFMNYQQTLVSSVVLKGIGLHSGNSIELLIHPARAHHGITFTRTDLKSSTKIPASFRSIVGTQLATSLGKSEKNSISTVEHVLAALHGLGIDNARIEVCGPEIPILDGSSAPFCDAIQKVGIEIQSEPRAVLKILRRVELKINEKWAIIEPCARFEIHASIEWDHPWIGYQEFRYVQGLTSFNELCSARTFGFMSEVESLKRMGLARGGSLENAVVLDEARVMNPEGLRFPDEFVRHKVLDTLGDLKLAGMPILGRVRLHRPGHDLHFQLLKAIFKDARNYEVLTGYPEEFPVLVPEVAYASSF